MRQLLWLGLLLLSASWLCFIPQFSTSDIPLGTAVLLLGLLCLCISLRHTKPQKVDMTYLLLLAPLLLTLVVLPFPYSLGIIILIIGLLTLVAFSYTQHTPALSYGLLLGGGILLVQTTVLPFYIKMISQAHRIDLFSPAASWLANLLGVQTSTTNGIVFLHSIQHIYPVITTWENLGFYLWLNFFVGAIVVFILWQKKQTILRNTIIVLLASIMYLLLRYIAILQWYLTTRETSIFYDPVLMMISFLPLSLLLMKLIPLNHIEKTTMTLPTLILTKRNLIAMLLIFMLIFSLTGIALYHDPGSMKQGRVLIDEYHSQWADTTRPMDTEWYGLLSTYNYYSWSQYLKHYYDVNINTESILTTELLAGYDILILKCPTESYSIQETQAIREFVYQGGGLYLIGDHTNVFGMNTFLNQVSELFGIRFRNDATYELGTGNLTVFYPDRLFVHPAIQHTPVFEFMTSCTLEPTSFLAALQIEPLIIGNKITSEPGTYATENFFRESVGATDAEYGYMLQAAAIKHGQGRVVAFTDSTVFSSFCMFTDGYPSFTLGVVEYLNRTNTALPLIRITLLIIAGFCGVGASIILQRTKKIKRLWMILFSTLLAFCLAAPFFSTINTMNYPMPYPHTRYTQICFEQQYSSFNVSIKPTLLPSSNKDDFGTFYVWTQRIGLVPSLEKNLNDAVQKADIIVLINPVKKFTESDVQIITNYLEGGGKIFIMDSIINSRSTANELTSRFGIWIMTNTNAQEVVFAEHQDNHENHTRGTMSSPSLSLTGGTPVLRNEENQTIATTIHYPYEEVGNPGVLLVVVDSYSFSDAVMGGLFTEPTEQQYLTYQTMFHLLETLL